MADIQLIYDLLKEMRMLQLEDHDILLEHKQMSVSNKKRIDILEKKAYIINWKQVGTIVGIISTLATLAYTLSRFL